MQTMLSAVVVAVIFLEGGYCFHWTAGPDDGNKTYVCDGQDLTLPWAILPDQGENITKAAWLFHGNSDRLVAFYTHGVFVPTPFYSQRVQHLPVGSLRLSNVTPEDEGIYTVIVNTDDGYGGHQTYNHSASVHVITEVAARTDVTLDIKQQARATYDNITGQYHLQLTCTSRGLQPPSVIWTTPLQQEMNSSITDSNGFSLLLPNPVAGGNYSCRVPLHATAAKCLSSTDPALEGASMYVDKMEARMTIMEAEHEFKNVQLTSLRQEASSLQQETLSLREETSSLRQENSDLRQLLQALESTASKQILFYAYLTSHTILSNKNTIIFPAVSVNQGRGYSTSTGRFTAPYSGRYYFSATAAASFYSTSSDLRVYANLRLMVNGIFVSGILTKSVDYYEMGSLHYGVHLTQGKQVWLESIGYRTFYGSNVPLTTFSGFLVSAD